MAYPCFTNIYRKASYPAIDPSRPELSVKDKTVIVTGAGEGSIGASVVMAFAKSGASKIALIGRTVDTLQKTKDAVDQAYPETTAFVVVADISKTESIGIAAHHIRATLGAWDIFAHCAGFLPELTTMTGADEDDWWKAFEVNTKFSHHFAKHFLPKSRPNATYISTNAATCHVPAALAPKNSAYAASKIAMVKLDEYLAEENPTLRVFTVHPGIIMSNMSKKFLGNDKEAAAGGVYDDPELPANFMVWLASPEADFLRSGRFLWANWDVPELIARKAEIEANPALFRINIGGWPFQ
ncbi:uncharacterized protein Z518_09967 [Rhinocladiella mackenziei CBS 650.93]|uniref:Uncharacterized protein n=1 Tax=Rhinocladiella mackenziei CBS 650.93 TaxID=1442369 RepID=A0A0D2FFY2_9EURO|nr:uncharacterized protein Z518_09967 [Rhinocladiella mackenziei CBS 650.93]KIX00902.1 hypothetical protein Z518_09967 [Rhinocladiella mackenziei CBS 650.93]